MKIFGWAADENTGCFRYRMQLPLEAARALGHEVHYTPRMPDEWRDAQTLIGQRVCLDSPSVRWQTHAGAGLNWCVYETDDDLLQIDRSSPVYRLFSKPNIRANLIRNIRSAQVVTVSTANLAEVIAPANSNTRVIPNAVPDSLPDLARTRAEQLTIGWTASAGHPMDWADHRGQIGRFLRRNPQVRFHLIGVDYAHRDGLPNYHNTRWVHGLDEYYRSIDFDIGVAPLRVGHEFNRSKSALKALEYGALGIPVIASAVRPYEEYVRHGETGFLVRQEHEWGRYLHALVSDEAMRLEMGEKARQVARQYTIGQILPLWIEAWTPQ